MTIMIIGCGKVGSALATTLSSEGYEVTVVDSDPQSFSRLGAGFRGMTFEGFECDNDVLRKAGIKNCDVVAAVTHDDNINIMAAQIATNIFGVRRVLTRIYDPETEEVYSKFGLHTVCPTRLTVDAVYSAAVDTELIHRTIHFGLTTLAFAVENISASDIGLTAAEKRTALAADNVDLLGIMHTGGDVSMCVEHGERRISAGDRLVITYRVD